MLTNTLKMTRFEVEKLPGGKAPNRAVPYLINTFRGKSLGIVGRVAENELPSSNDSDFSRRAGLKRLLHILGW